MTAFAFQLTAGALPSGLSLNARTGVISGKTYFVGTANFTLRATGTSGCFGSRDYRLIINCPTIALGFAASPPTPEIAVALPAGTVNVSYNRSLAATPTGTTYLYSRVAADGALPPGLTLNPPPGSTQTGVLRGTPTTAGHYTFRIRAQGFGTCAGTQLYSLRIN